MIYLDNAATTYPKPECVYEALDYANRNLAFNAGRGSYTESKKAFDVIKEAKKEVASLVGVNGDKVSFLSSATEALNIIINGLGLKDGDVVYVSPFEHNAIIRPLYNLQNQINLEIQILPFNNSSFSPNINEIKNLFARKRPAAVFISHVSNVIGCVIDYESVFNESKKYMGKNILDCAQSFGILNPNINNVDFIIFAGHKSLYSSFGIAGFLNITDFNLRLTKTGGNGSDSLNHNMPESGGERYEAGSQNIVAIFGLLNAIKWIKKTDIYSHEKKLVRYAIEKLEEIPYIHIYSNSDSLGIVSFNMDNYLPGDVANILSSEFDICVRSGFHCSPFVHDLIDTIDTNGTVRVSFGAFTTIDDIDNLINALKTF